MKIPSNATVSFGYYRRLNVITKSGDVRPQRVFAAEEVSVELFWQRWSMQLAKDRKHLHDMWHQARANYYLTHAGKHCFNHTKGTAVLERDFTSKRKLRTSRHETLNESRI